MMASLRSLTWRAALGLMATATRQLVPTPMANILNFSTRFRTSLAQLQGRRKKKAEEQDPELQPAVLSQ